MKLFNEIRLAAVLVVAGFGCLSMAINELAAQNPDYPRGTDENVPPPLPGRLPWEQPPATPQMPTFRPPANPLEILERYDIGKSQFDGFFNGQPLERSEEDVLVKILYRFSRFGLDNIQRWRVRGVTWDQLAAAPSDHRAEFFHLRGRVQHVDKQLLIPEHSSRYEYTHFYRVRMKLDDSPYTALIFARHVPSAWKLETPIDERAAADGLFLKLGNEPLDEESPPPMPEAADLPNLDQARLFFAAGRVAWLPDQAEPENHITPDHLQLATLGVDIGLLEQVRQGNGKPIGDGDREAFYQILDALGRADPAALRRPKIAEPIDVGPLLNTPPELHGKIMPVRGLARRIVKVLVDDHDIRKRFGIDHYYEIDLFLPLGDARVMLGKDRTGQENPIYENTYPATLNVRRLPPGMKEGDDVREVVRADAVFFKVWSYHSNFAANYGKLQPAPMFLGLEPTLIKEPIPRGNWVSESLVGLSLGVAALIIISVLWFYRRGDRRARESLRGVTSPALPDKPDFSNLG